MNVYMNGNVGQPRDQTEDHFSMFFDFDTPGQTPPASISGSITPKSQQQPQRSGIRVSLACVPCRSRHVKCGAEMPACNRCLQDDKSCFYAKSRRGMRDRTVPKKRVSLREAGKGSPGSSSRQIRSSSANLAMGSSVESFTGHHSDSSDSPSSASSRPSTVSPCPKRLVELYYSCFHKAHPVLLPKYYFLSRYQTDPDSLRTIVPIMQYLGSLFANDLPSDEMKMAAMSVLDDPTLPPNGFTVQALLLTAIAVHSQDDMLLARTILDRAIYLALDLRMNSRTFANMERDPVLAESWRRTYWFLYVTDAIFAGIRRAASFFLYSVEATVELPCEECDYDGIIPRSRTLEEYEARDFEDEAIIYSSFTYLIDLTRIMGSIFGFDRQPAKTMKLTIENADAMLVNWKLHLPKEKQSVVDKYQEVDEILFTAQNILHLLLIFIHRPLSSLAHSPIESISDFACPALPQILPTQDDPSTWLHTKKTLEAAEAAISLYALPCKIVHHTPLSICGITLSTLANLGACTHLLQGIEWCRVRDRIRLGLGGLKAMGEVWAVARRTERETKRIARDVFALNGGQVSGEMPKEGLERVEIGSAIPMHQESTHGDSMQEVAWTEMDREAMNYFATWDLESFRT